VEATHLPGLAAAYDAFTATSPEYLSTRRLDELRAADYGRIDAHGHVYLDYTGGSLYGESQIRAHADLLAAHVFGNPHSVNESSTAVTRLVERTRRAVLEWFNAGDDYVAVFTANATASLKLVGEAYPFGPGSRALFTFDNHNSVNGVREFACARGARVDYAPLTTPELRLDRPRLTTELADTDPRCPNLFAFPAQSNFSGVKHPLEIVSEAQHRGWDVLLDAAAYVPTNRLDLQATPADFVVLSFYKMFGYPTGVGCLLIRRQALDRLCRPWFAGGTVNFATVQGRAHRLSPGEAGFEDGTLNYLSIPAVEIGLRRLAEVGMDTINTRVRCLTAWLLRELVALRHSNGRPMVRVYGPITTEMRGGTVTLNIYDPDGHLVDYRRIEELASEQHISVRTGCFCNPGTGETAEGLTEDDMLAGAAGGADMNLARFVQLIQQRAGKSAGALRMSLGLVTNFADVYRFVQFVAGFRDQARLLLGTVTFDIESCRIVRDGS
jgi:selenocysteine lyase/cysteine desulfurase